MGCTMKTKIYYLTRTYYPYQKGGGPLMRMGAVKYLQELGWNVIVVMPNYGSNKINIDDWERNDCLWGSEYLWGLYCGKSYYSSFRDRVFGVWNIMI